MGTIPARDANPLSKVQNQINQDRTSNHNFIRQWIIIIEDDTSGVAYTVGFNPNNAARSDGQMMDPSVSVPIEMGENPEATPTALPEDEPQGSPPALNPPTT